MDFSLELIKDLIDFARVGKKLNRFLEDLVRSSIDFSKNSQGFGMEPNVGGSQDTLRREHPEACVKSMYFKAMKRLRRDAHSIWKKIC